ncbi:MAG: hypothetical protein NTY80_01375 [candidate division SR1 bacterium]|nr:hypothetical protein [candidate division SR1 bacterium]
MKKVILVFLVNNKDQKTPTHTFWANVKCTQDEESRIRCLIEIKKNDPSILTEIIKNGMKNPSLPEAQAFLGKVKGLIEECHSIDVLFMSEAKLEVAVESYSRKSLYTYMNKPNLQ